MVSGWFLLVWEPSRWFQVGFYQLGKGSWIFFNHKVQHIYLCIQVLNKDFKYKNGRFFKKVQKFKIVHVLRNCPEFQKNPILNFFSEFKNVFRFLEICLHFQNFV